MDIRQLKYVAEIVRWNSFTIAAEHLHITQPTISKMIKSLEEELGEQLFTREGKQVRLTDTGEVIMKYAQPILAQFDQLQTEISDLTYLNSGKLVLGIPPMAGSRFFPYVIKQFYDQYPGISITVVEDGAARIEQRIDRGELDAGVVLWPLDVAKYDYFPLASEKLKVLMHPKHRLAGRKQIRLKELSQDSFILFNKDFALHDVIIDACHSASFHPRIVTESSQWDFIGQMVAADLGVAMMPGSICKLMDQREVTTAELIEPVIPWELVMAWRRDGYLSLAARAWIDFTRDLFRNMNI